MPPLNEIAQKIRKRFRHVVLGRRFSMPPELEKAGRLSGALNHIRRRWAESFDPAGDSESPVFHILCWLALRFHSLAKTGNVEWGGHHLG